MASSASCSRCRRALPTEVDGDLCPACRGAEEGHAADLVSAGVTASAPTARPPVPPVEHEPSLPDTTPAQHPSPGATPAADHRYLPEPPPGYDLICRLGAGATGTVYLAREHAAERTVAMKMLNSPGSAAAFERFLIEARVLARLDHPNIVKVIAVETNWREPFLTMEFADGGTLADLTRRGRLPTPTEAARMVLAAAEAVAAAHAAGVIHRDIKPSNILLHGTKGEGPATPDAGPPPAQPPGLTPKVSDFGLAKRTDRDEGLTRTGPLGTPGYMSPEAAAGRYREVGPAADVYGLGATLYHLLTGRPPFTAETPDQIIQKVLTDVPTRPRAVRPDLPAELEGVVVKAMEKDPAARYPGAAALAADLRRFLEGKLPEAPVQSWRRRAGRWARRNRKRIATAVAAVALAAALVAAGVLLRPDPPDPEQPIRDEIAAGKTVRLLTPDGRPRVPAWPLGAENFAATTHDGGTCTFGSREMRVLLLLKDPGVDRYRVRAEICQIHKFGTVQKHDEVGLVLAFAEQDGANGARVRSMVLLKYSDYDLADEKADRTIDLMDRALVELPRALAHSDHIVLGVRPAPLDRRGAGGLGWRELVAEVNPEGVRVPGPQPGQLQLADVAGITVRRKGPSRPNGPKSLQDMIAPRAGPVVLPDWSPRMPLGIWTYGSQVSVRNVTIEALK